MRRTLEEQMIERYLSGEMTGSQEQDFFMRIAVDSNLRQRLKAYRIVESAMLKHRDAIPASHAAARAQLIRSLGAPSTAPALHIAKRMSGIRKWIVGGMATSLVVALTAWLMPTLLTDSASPYAPSVQTNGTAPAVVARPQQPAQSANLTANEQRHEVIENVQPTVVGRSAAVSNTKNRRERDGAASRRQRSHTTLRTNNRAPVRAIDNSASTTTQKAENDGVPTVFNPAPINVGTRDSVGKLNIRVNVPK